MPKGGQLSKSLLLISGKDEQVHFIQLLVVNEGDGFEIHEFLFVPSCNCVC